MSRVEDIDARIAHRRQSKRTRTRRRRFIMAFGAVAVAAFETGMVMGWVTRTTREELMEEASARKDSQSGVDAEVNRVLREPWKMEDVEASRNRGRIR